MSDDTKDGPDSPDDVRELLELTERGEQTPEGIARLMALHHGPDERAYGVRPEIILDMSADNADWIRDPKFLRVHHSSPRNAESGPSADGR